MAFRAEVQVVGETGFNHNALVFATAEEAERYARDLYSRWMAVEKTRVEPTDKPANYVWDFEQNTYHPIGED